MLANIPLVSFFLYFVVRIPAFTELTIDSPLRDPEFRHLKKTKNSLVTN